MIYRGEKSRFFLLEQVWVVMLIYQSLEIQKEFQYLVQGKVYYFKVFGWFLVIKLVGSDVQWIFGEFSFLLIQN